MLCPIFGQVSKLRSSGKRALTFVTIMNSNFHFLIVVVIATPRVTRRLSTRSFSVRAACTAVLPVAPVTTDVCLHTFLLSALSADLSVN